MEMDFAWRTCGRVILNFLSRRGTCATRASPLVPVGDKSILLINAGMTPLKKYFTGEEEPPRLRMTTCQKCIRTPDIDRVGLTARHGTFFEMLGQFLVRRLFQARGHHSGRGEYITKWLKIPADRLWVTIYLDDDEAFDIWSGEVGVPADRIVRLGKEGQLLGARRRPVRTLLGDPL